MGGPGFSIDRPALERILQRAAELQTSERDIGEGLTPDEVMALGKEVGIPGHFLQQAMLEERARIEPAAANGLADRMAGPAVATAQRVILGDRDDVARTLIAYMEEHELLCVQRAQPERITWEPLGGFPAAIRRSTAAFGSSKRPFMLSHAASVTATFLPLESGYVHVTLSAEARGMRRLFIGWGTAIAGLGAVSAAVLAVLTPFAVVAAAPVPIALGAGYFTMRQFAPRIVRMQLGLERALDDLQQGNAGPKALPPRAAGVLGLIANEVRKAIKP